MLPVATVEAPRVGLELVLFSLSVFFLLPAWGPLPPKEGSTEISGARVLTEV